MRIAKNTLSRTATDIATRGGALGWDMGFDEAWAECVETLREMGRASITRAGAAYAREFADALERVGRERKPLR